MIKDQVIYLGPRLNAFGIGYGAVFYNGRHSRLQDAIDSCPSVAQLLVPVAEAGTVRRALDFDYAHNMRGTTGKHVVAYQEIQNWLDGPKWVSGQNSRQKQQPSTIIKTHA